MMVDSPGCSTKGWPVSGLIGGEVGVGVGAPPWQAVKDITIAIASRNLRKEESLGSKSEVFISLIRKPIIIQAKAPNGNIFTSTGR